MGGRAESGGALLTGRAPRAGEARPRPRPARSPGPGLARGLRRGGREGKGGAAPRRPSAAYSRSEPGAAEPNKAGALGPAAASGALSERPAPPVRPPTGSQARARPRRWAGALPAGKAAKEKPGGRGWEYPGPARRRSRYLEPAGAGPGRAGGGSAERRERGPGARRSPPRGNNRPAERRQRPRAPPRPLARPPARQPRPPIGRDAPFESRGGRSPLAEPAMARGARTVPPRPAPRRRGGGRRGALGPPTPALTGVMAEGRESGAERSLSRRWGQAQTACATQAPPPL